VQLVYFDADHPSNPMEVNHVTIRVDIGNEGYMIESTAKSDGLNVWAGKKISGWNYDV